MPAGSVRAAIVSWLQGTTGVANVYQTMPGGDTGIPPQAFVTASGAMGPVLVVHIEHQTETRLTPPAGQGIKQIDYDIGVVVMQRWPIPADAGDETGWVNQFDTALDNVRARIRQDFTLGTNGNPIWQAGENVGDISTTYDLPKDDGLMVEQWSVVQFRAIEMFQPA